jgi:hypothetical protein
MNEPDPMLVLRAHVAATIMGGVLGRLPDFPNNRDLIIQARLIAVNQSEILLRELKETQ